MNKNDSPPVTTGPAAGAEPSLRQRAEEIARQKEDLRPELHSETPEETRQNLHELLVHQIQLEMQNEELRCAQAELEEARARYADLYDFAPVGYCTVSEKGLILEINLTATRLLGLPRSALINKPFSRFVYKDDQDVYYLHKLELFKTDEPQTFELRIKKTDGTIFWAHLVAIAIQDADDMRISRIVLSDVTERKQAEEAFRKSEQRALSLVEELQKADKNKNDFISILSHELRNPLATIVAGLSLLDISEDAYKNRDTEMIIKRQISQLCRLVDDLLDLTRITNNKIQLKKERVELKKIAMQAVQDYKALFDRKGNALETQMDAYPIYLDADPVRLTQIIGNLLNNSLKFTEKGGKTALAVYVDKNEAVISVKDNGIGFEAAMLADLFEPFKQADNSLDRRNGGLGLGLSITKGIAELHGGSVSAASGGPGKGSEFIIRLPLAPAVLNEKSKGQESENCPRAFKILIIEDNLDFSSVLCSILERMGHSADIANSGLKGIEKAKKTRPDVIVCDIGLPGMDGYDVAKKIRMDESFNRAYMIALSGYAEAPDIELALTSGFNKHISKPVDINVLRRILAEAQLDAEDCTN